MVLTFHRCSIFSFGWDCSWLAKVIVYTVIAGAILGMAFGTYTMWSMYEAQQEYVASADVINSTVVRLVEWT